MVIDFHTHTFPEELAGRAIGRLAASSRARNYLDGTAGALRASMREAGVDYSVLLPVVTRPGQQKDINQAAVETNRHSAETGLISFGGIHPENEDYRAILRGLAENGVRGVKIIKVFRKIDHMMIFVLIAGSYTPVCLIVLGGRLGYTLLAVVWGIAILGIGVKALWITCPKWFSSILYISMGWVCIGVFGPLWSLLPRAAFLWLLAGGVIYTIGGVIYALKLPLFNSKHANFGSHEIFHLFVMGGSICHFIFMYLYVA